MKFNYLMTVLRTMKMPGLFPIMKDWQSHVRMHFLYAGLESGLLETLCKPSTRDELLMTLGLKRPEILDALLDVGVSVKELGCKDGFYSLKGKRAKALTGKNGDVLAAMIQANVTYYGATYRHAAQRMYGAPLGDDLNHIGELVARFGRLLEPIIRQFIKGIVSKKDVIRVLDVGCGSGEFLRTVHTANPNTTGMGIDMDKDVVELANQNMATWGLSDRLKIVDGDIRTHPVDLEGPFDLIMLFNVIYYFTAKERLALLRRLGSILSQDGAVATAMHFKSQGRDMGAANLNLVNSSVKGLTPLPDLDGLISLFKEAGLGKITVQRLLPSSTFYGVVAGSGT
jgi:SAM-dependent methyltransferase